MGLFVTPIYSKSAEESIRYAISNLNIFLEGARRKEDCMDYLFFFAESCIDDARKKIQEGKVWDNKPSGPMTYKVEKGA